MDDSSNSIIMGTDSLNFYQQLFERNNESKLLATNEMISTWAAGLICLLYPALATCPIESADELEQRFMDKKAELSKLISTSKSLSKDNQHGIVDAFFTALPEIFRRLEKDVEAIEQGDPAAQSSFEVIRAYPGFYALCFFRIAHALHNSGLKLIPRILTEHAHARTGIDIHPAASIGEYFCIDHGTGIVIGETAVIGDHVKIYQGVTLGALSVEKEMANTRRHPRVEDHVIIYSNATILGGDTVIGHHSVIGGNVWLTQSVGPGSLVTHQADMQIIEGKFLKSSR